MVKKQILLIVALGVLLTALVAVATAISQILELGSQETMLAQATAFLAMGVFLTVYINVGTNKPAEFGFRKYNFVEIKSTLYYIPLIIIVFVQPIIIGLNHSLTLFDVILTLVFTLLVGYVEELLFRAIVRQKLRDRSITFYIIFSSVFFGILHMAHAFNEGVLYGTLLVMNAFLVGLMLSALYVLAENIIPLIIFHFAYDFLAMLNAPSPDGSIASKEIIAIVVLNILYLAYFIYLCVAIKNRNSKLKKVTA